MTQQDLDRLVTLKKAKKKLITWRQRRCEWANWGSGIPASTPVPLRDVHPIVEPEVMRLTRLRR